MLAHHLPINMRYVLLLRDKQAPVDWCWFALMSSNLSCTAPELISHFNLHHFMWIDDHHLSSYFFFLHFFTESGFLQATGHSSKQKKTAALKWAKTLSYAQQHKILRAFDGGKHAMYIYIIALMHFLWTAADLKWELLWTLKIIAPWKQSSFL